MDPEFREWAANKNPNMYTDLMVVHSLPQKIIANFCLIFNRTINPTKIFNNLESAIDWRLDQVEKLDKS